MGRRLGLYRVERAAVHSRTSRAATGRVQDTGSNRADCVAAPTYNFDPDYLYADPDNSLPFITNASAAFKDPAPGKLGNCGRNSARLPGFRNST
jgi:hypothetical protein